jgi:two-component system cell cycle sensor histidine kinase/response regulator CckA
LDRTTELYLKNKELKAETEEREELQRLVSHQQSVESLGTLASGIAHDFNNILAIVVAHASLLKTSSATNLDGQKRVGAILSASERGSGLVRQLLALTRRETVSKEPVYINDIVVELKQLLADTFPHAITINVNLSDDVHPVFAEKTLIHQALLNLCVNARDAMPNGGRLTITTEMIAGRSLVNRSEDATEADYVSLRVQDTGIGMDDETQRRVFEPFFTTKEAGKGTGLGLAITHSIVSACRGFCAITSAPDEGTTLTLYFPAMQARDNAIPSLKTLEPELSFRKRQQM